VKKKIKVKYASSGLLMGILIIVIGLLNRCAPPILNLEGWKIIPDAKKEILFISHENLGPLLNNVRLVLKDGGRMVPLSEWQVKLKKDRIIISTQKPGLTTWTFSPSKEGIAISTSAKNALLRGVAPAGEDVHFVGFCFFQ